MTSINTKSIQDYLQESLAAKTALLSLIACAPKAKEEAETTDPDLISRDAQILQVMSQKSLAELSDAAFWSDDIIQFLEHANEVVAQGERNSFGNFKVSHLVFVGEIPSSDGATTSAAILAFIPTQDEALFDTLSGYGPQNFYQDGQLSDLPLIDSQLGSYALVGFVLGKDPEGNEILGFSTNIYAESEVTQGFEMFTYGVGGWMRTNASYNGVDYVSEDSNSVAPEIVEAHQKMFSLIEGMNNESYSISQAPFGVEVAEAE